MIVYGKAAHHNLTAPRREALTKLSRMHRTLLEPFYSDYLLSIDRAIDVNSQFMTLVAQIGANNFEAPQERQEWQGATSIQVDHTKSTLKQLYRDWSMQGKSERDVAYRPVIEALNDLFEINKR